MRPVQRAIRLILRRLGLAKHSWAVSSDYVIFDHLCESSLAGWRTGPVPERQHRIFKPLLEAVKAGQARQDFLVAARAIAATGITDPLVVEVGCGSGYYNEVLSILLDRPIRYVGLDYSAGMVAVGRNEYPGAWFLTADAGSLPIKTQGCDILFSGTSLMHILDYQQAIAESARVARQWCIFHTVPVMANRTTTIMGKRAYGEPVIEIIFNQSELEAFFLAQGLLIHQVFESIPYDVSFVLGERSWTLTYLCRKRQR